MYRNTRATKGTTAFKDITVGAKRCFEITLPSVMQQQSSACFGRDDCNALHENENHEKETASYQETKTKLNSCMESCCAGNTSKEREKHSGAQVTNNSDTHEFSGPLATATPPRCFFSTLFKPCNMPSNLAPDKKQVMTLKPGMQEAKHPSDMQGRCTKPA